jgi:exodeoxyribonuclease-3
MSHTITTVNVNGIRAAVRKGMSEWLSRSDADIVCLQETRASDDEIVSSLDSALGSGWHLASAEPSQKGRNGVAILSREPFESVTIGIGSDEFDSAGRYIEAVIDGVTVGSLYLPTGEAGTEKQQAKERFMSALAARMATLEATGVDAVMCGDWNIAHTERDLKNWKANRAKSGFLPAEREWITALLSGSWVDVVRELHPDVDGPYSWWSYRGRAFDNDAGWRIDYHLATTDFADRAKDAVVERAPTYDTRWSDHAPVTVVYR